MNRNEQNSVSGFKLLLHVVSGMVMDELVPLVPYDIWIREREIYTRNVSRQRSERTTTTGVLSNQCYL